MRHMRRISSLWILAMASLAAGADWPQFLGPTRNGHSSETGLLREWPKDGLTKAWERKVGAGFSGPAVAGGKLILFHRVGDDEVVECLDAKTGKEQWKHAAPTGYIDDFRFDEGSRATPIIAAEHVYTLGAEGRLTCLGFKTGNKVWSRDLATDYPFRKSYFGVGTSPLVDGDRVFVNVGSKGAGVVAFDRKTGKELWKATNDRASYSTPTVAEIRGKRIAIQEYGIPNRELVSELEARGAAVVTIPIYRWALPEDLTPLREAIRKILQSRVDVALFTNATQVEHLFRVASYDKADDSLRLAFKNVVIGSVGPVCTQVLEQFGLKPDLEPTHPKMGSLLAEVAESAHRLLAAKSVQ